MYDIVIIGGGPAGLTAAIYLARAKYRVIVVEKEHFGGQITITDEVVNYPGLLKTSGKELTDTMRMQAEHFGAEFLLSEVTHLNLDGDIKEVHTNRGVLKCFGVLLATGAHPRQIGFQGESDFKGRGVAYCATCDGEFFTGKEVFVIGGGYAAAEESIFLTKYATHVTILMRGDDFTCAQSIADAAKNHDKISVITNTEVEAVSGDTKLNYIRYRNTKTGEVTEYRSTSDTFGVFVFAGYEPATDLVKGIAELNQHGYILTDDAQKTSVEGLYAAGDVCVKPLRQVVTAVGEGALAATELERVASLMQKKTGIVPEIPNQQKAELSSESSSLFTKDMIAQLETVFQKMESSLTLKLYLDQTALSADLKNYMEVLCSLTPKLQMSISNEQEKYVPCVKIFKEDGNWTGLAFHGVPGGHEFTSFVLGLYNASGTGQALDSDIIEQIKSIHHTISLQIFVSLSCAMCPELVVAAQKIATLNPNITAEVYDVIHFQDLKEKYDIMSVPCLVVNDTEVSFGKKNISQLLTVISNYLN